MYIVDRSACLKLYVKITLVQEVQVPNKIVMTISSAKKKSIKLQHMYTVVTLRFARKS